MTACKIKPEGASQSEQICYRILCKAADRGEPCPSNDAIAAVIGYRDSSAARKVMFALEKRGWIEIGAVNSNRRFVTIMATGISTLPSAPGRRSKTGVGRYSVKGEKAASYESSGSDTSEEFTARMNARHGSNALLAALARVKPPADVVVRPAAQWRRQTETYVPRVANS